MERTPLTRDRRVCLRCGSGVPPVERVFLSVVIPCFNEEEGLGVLHHRVHGVCESIGETFEMVMVNDGSTDGTGEALIRLAGRAPNIVVVNLSRNFGHERALLAGLTVCCGANILILDADLQDPPELLPEMLRLIQAGADVVYGRRRARMGETWFKRVTAWAFYRVFDFLSDVAIPRDTGHFRLLRRRVLDVVLEMPEQRLYLRGLISWAGFRQVPIDYDRAPRLVGAGKWPLKKMLGLAGDAITGFSIKPMRFVCCLGAVCAALVLGIAGCWLALPTGDRSANELPIVISLIAILFGFQFSSLAVIGEYIGRIWEQSRGRPLFVIESVVPSSLRSDAHPGQVTRRD